MMKSRVWKRLLPCLALSALLLGSVARAAEGTFFIDADGDGLRGGEEHILTDDGGAPLAAARANIPAGYGISAGHSLDGGEVPLRAVAAVRVLSAPPIDMRSPYVPPALYTALDAAGNALDAPGGAFSGGNAIRPPTIIDGSVLRTFTLGDLRAEAAIPYTFSHMNSIEKANYSYARGWLSAAEYLRLAEQIKAGAPLPEEYRSSVPLDPYTPVARTESTATPPAFDTSGHPYVDTRDGNVRIVHYDVATGQAPATDQRAAVKAYFDEQGARNRVLALLGKKSVPQEQNGPTLAVFNSNLHECGGQVIQQRDGTFRIELGLAVNFDTVAHEYAHIVQSSGYGVVSKKGSHIWWMEGTADYIGRVLSGRDHYLARLGAIQHSPWVSYASADSARSYGTAAYAFFLESKKSGAVAQTFQNGASYTSARAMINARYSHAQYFSEYARKMYHPGAQMPRSLSERAHWPPAAAFSAGPLTSSPTVLNRTAMQDLSADYIRVDLTGAKTIQVTPIETGGVQLWLLMRGKGSADWTYARVTKATAVSGANARVRELVLCAVNTTGAAQGYAVRLEAN